MCSYALVLQIPQSLHKNLYVKLRRHTRQCKLLLRILSNFKKSNRRIKENPSNTEARGYLSSLTTVAVVKQRSVGPMFVLSAGDEGDKHCREIREVP
ncbi:hypothetical protein ElyMa_004202000 [Elysia marginata]|uniref:Uncharacterized protein n=1 Tax=Elysia marginata TaxID=1093978 RepID=A0AAV4GM94_9GAST|nr:hypothetical protein ElyMa_004202000 [Elysia marginata]